MTSPIPTVRLVTKNAQVPLREWDSQLFLNPKGIWRLRGVAGSGVSTLLMDTVAHQLRQGRSPDEILVIAASKEAASRLREGIIHRVIGLDYSAAATMVRSIHSLAFALVRSSCEEQLRLITGAEQDAVIRELLAGHADSGASMWPQEVREAVNLLGFARGIRDFLLRATERGLSPETLEQLGKKYNRDMWYSAGAFMREYEQVISLRGQNSLSAAELVTKALEKPIEDQGWKMVLIDDAQHLDPQSARLITELLAFAEFGVIAGDSHQLIHRFRGASAEFLDTYPVDHTVELTSSWRTPISEVEIFPTAAAESTFVADTVRRAHLLNEVPWSQIAVVVRSTSQIGQVRRNLLSAGVPVHVDPTAIVLSEQRIVANLLIAARALTQKITNAELEELITGPIGGADPVTMRRLFRSFRQVELRRVLADPDADSSSYGRRAIDLMRLLVLPGQDELQRTEFLLDAATILTPIETEVLERIRTVFSAGEQALHQQASVEEILWELWNATGLDQHLLAMSLRGGAIGSQADRDLDSVMALFDAAGDWVERYPQAKIASFVTHIEEQILPTGVRDRRLATPDAVHIMTAHATTGLQWHTVIVTGVQEGTWPALGETGTLFAQEELVDLIDADIDPDLPISRSSDRLNDERNLFYVATTRATKQLVITAVDAPDADEVLEVSRFITELSTMKEHPEASSEAEPLTLFDVSTTVQAPTEDNALGYQRLLSIPAMVAELRRALIDPAATTRQREQAARQLARLAQAKIPGAHPDQWWGSGGVSDMSNRVVTALSPSKIDSGLHCPLRAALSSVVNENEEKSVHRLKGTLVHAFAEALGNGVDAEEAEAMVSAAYRRLLQEPSWKIESTMEEFQQLLVKLKAWIEAAAGGFDLVGTEVKVNVDVLPAVAESDRQGLDKLIIRGRIDRLDKVKDSDSYRIVDFKTGTPKTKEQAQEDAQLMSYQLALRNGQIHSAEVLSNTDISGGLDIDSAQLVYPASGSQKIAIRDQASKDTEQLSEFARLLPSLLIQLRSPQIIARLNNTCSHCPLTTLCPVHEDGKVVIS
ncbi:PD-(D/E)XK nuclease family protein [Corynebacterium kutscheri]|uniref:PD-(D/E)XK nuclease family protein n=1 Tax=Corynebacterium kutscheri TaxID=35755 RepID=UPI0037BF2294